MECDIDAAMTQHGLNEMRIDDVDFVLISKMDTLDCFDFDIDNGKIFFRMTNCFCDSLIGKEAYEYMINCLLSMLDEYSEQFKLLAEGSISLDEFVDRNGI